MLSNEQKLIDACKEEPSLIFQMIKKGHFEIVEKLIEENEVDVNLVDGVGNDVVTRLLKARQYDLVVSLMKKRNWDVNHKNDEGNTFGHVLAHDNTLCAVKVAEHLNKKKNYLPNLKNNKGETTFDRALNSNYLCTAIKLIEDKRFNSINLSSFKNFCNVLLKSREYGKYTKANTLEIVVENLENRDLESGVAKLIDHISNNMEVIKRDIIDNNSEILHNLIKSY